MEAKVVSEVVKDQRKIQLVDGTFTPTEASDVITALIDEKINFHKIQRLKIWEGNHLGKTNLLDSRIGELEQEKLTARNIIDHARAKGKQIVINGTLEIKYVD
ncbi:hypothetical protein LDL77_16715 [Flagellimonas marinaquae]|uniref:Uncharacterized protein n=1 Tax=Flagellimonas aurea TaxID=2915619 RepID=A0ABS3G3F2_9FLAO|nr:hypothetical protein [Allomuricauda aurea]MBO0353381.1 hypothetical protein [Allomuricauda aurea]UBZ13512.1 hypothetical protein LDL77_16715 [Allomuricauda aquimarina]